MDNKKSLSFLSNICFLLLFYFQGCVSNGKFDGKVNKISVWKLKSTKHDEKAAVMHLIHESTLPSFSSDVSTLFVSEKYIITIFQRMLDATVLGHEYELFFQVRSTFDFNVVYSSGKQLGDSSFLVFSFANDILAIQLRVNGNELIWYLPFFSF